MATKKAPKKKTGPKLNPDDPPIIVGGGGSTLISLPKGTTGTTVGQYDVYKVKWNVKTIVRKNSKNGRKQKSKPTDNGYEVEFWKSDF